MTMIQLVIVLVVIGVVLWMINAFLPMNASIKKVLNVVVILSVIIYVLWAFGILGQVPIIRLPH